jgi:alkyl hydroperoxide reductase subunit AhpC
MTDQTKVISKAYGVHKDDQGVANRGLFIIDNLGNLRQVIINDLGVGRSVDEAMRLVQAYQHVDKNGEVCPVNWKPGQPAIKVDPNQHKSRSVKRKRRDTPDNASGDNAI